MDYEIDDLNQSCTLVCSDGSGYLYKVVEAGPIDEIVDLDNCDTEDLDCWCLWRGDGTADVITEKFYRTVSPDPSACDDEGNRVGTRYFHAEYTINVVSPNLIFTAMGRVDRYTGTVVCSGGDPTSTEYALIAMYKALSASEPLGGRTMCQVFARQGWWRIGDDGDTAGCGSVRLVMQSGVDEASSPAHYNDCTDCLDFSNASDSTSSGIASITSLRCP